jgi:aldose 1-epimerase
LDAACDGLDINHVFDGVTHGATVTDDVLRVRVTSSLSRLVVSTHPGKDFIAIEPVSHITDAFNRAGDPALGTVVLGHGRAFAAQMVIAAVPAD